MQPRFDSWLVVPRWLVERRRGDEISDHRDDGFACEAGEFGLANQLGEARAHPVMDGCVGHGMVFRGVRKAHSRALLATCHLQGLGSSGLP